MHVCRALARLLLLCATGLVLAGSANGEGDGAEVASHLTVRLEQLRSQALLLALEQRHEAALVRLEEALSLAPDDPQSRLAWAALQNHLGHYLQVSEALGMSSSAASYSPLLARELGTALYQQGRYAEAAAALERIDPADDEGRYLAALALYRSDDLGAALARFSTLGAEAKGAELRESALFAEARIELEQGQRPQALSTLRRLAEGYPDGVHASEVARLRADLDPARAPPLTWGASVGLVADSNVGQFPSERPLPLGVSADADQRLQLGLQGQWRPRAAQGAADEWGLGYQLFISKHAQLSAYDMQNHSLSADWSRRGSRATWGVDLGITHTLLDGATYLDRYRLTPSLSYPHSEERVSQLEWMWEGDRFANRAMAGYDGHRMRITYRYLAQWGEARRLFLAAHLGQDRTDDRALAAAERGLGVGGDGRFGGIDWGAELRLSQSEYADARPSARHDHNTLLRLQALYPLHEGLDLLGAYTRIDNASDSDDFGYARNLFEVQLRWRP